MNYQFTKDALPSFNSPEKSTFSPVNDVCFTTRSTHLPRTLRMYSTRVPPAKGRCDTCDHLACVAPPLALRGRRRSGCAGRAAAGGIASLVETDDSALLVEAGFPDRHRCAACLQTVLFRNGCVDGDGVIAIIGNGKRPLAVGSGFGFRRCLAGQRDGDVGDRLLGRRPAGCR